MARVSQRLAQRHSRRTRILWVHRYLPYRIYQKLRGLRMHSGLTFRGTVLSNTLAPPSSSYIHPCCSSRSESSEFSCRGRSPLRCCELPIARDDAAFEVDTHAAGAVKIARMITSLLETLRQSYGTHGQISQVNAKSGITEYDTICYTWTQISKHLHARSGVVMEDRQERFR